MTPPTDARGKGWPASFDGDVAQLANGRPSMFDVELSWPVMVLRDSAVEHNITAMADWCSSRGISLAPHGKTTMCPELFSRQLAEGAWALTAATPWQVRTYRSMGVQRILLANELTDAAFVGWLAADVDADSDFDFFCYVDSVAGVQLLAAAMTAAGGLRPLQLLVEVGVPGGRTGCRSDTDVESVATEVSRHRSLSLVGVAGYEGPLGHSRDAATQTAVRAYVDRLGDTLSRLDAADLLDERATELILTCGGSGHVDVVSAALTTGRRLSHPVRPVLRSGSYITHDDGLYAATSSMAGQLRAAIEIWCQVLSRPEPGVALLGAGRRDVSFDAGLPVPLWRRASSTGDLTPLPATVTALNDQHAFLEIGDDVPLEVGDLVCLGISHPCTTFDKWQLIFLVDDERRIIDCLRTYF
jgi:D-serine deaminase-like pyridoxal phosphate-dependent protein